jgi:hypothetical protein
MFMSVFKDYSYLNKLATDLKFKPTFKEFFSQKIPKQYFKTDLDWHEARRLLKHPDCPVEFAEHFLQSNVWYIRLAAGLSKPNVQNLLPKLFKDPKSTVRAAAFKRVLADEKFDHLFLEVRDLIVQDERIKNYLHNFLGPNAYTLLKNSSNPTELWMGVK